MTTAVLPAGWRERLVTLRTPGTRPGQGLCLEPHDLVVSKLVAHREKDQGVRGRIASCRPGAARDAARSHRVDTDQRWPQADTPRLGNIRGRPIIRRGAGNIHWPGGHSWVRTGDPSLVRRIGGVAGWCWASPAVASACGDDWLAVVRCLRSLALGLALWILLPDTPWYPLPRRPATDRPLGRVRRAALRLPRHDSEGARALFSPCPRGVPLKGVCGTRGRPFLWGSP